MTVALHQRPAFKRVYKKLHANQEYLLAYLWDATMRTWLAVGPHENFYRDLKR